MPWTLVHNHPACRAGEWAVVNQRAEAEGRHSIEGCHPTRERALAQQRALYANEPQAHSQEGQSMERKTLVAPVEWKAVSDDPGALEGYLSVFGNVDEGGDVVLPGAFKKTLADWSRAKQPIPLLVDHKMSTDGMIGSIADAREDDVGLRFHARFSSIAKAQDIRTLMLEGHLNGMSFTYEPIRSRPGTKAGQRVRYLDELRLFEGTVTPFPMNTLAVSSSVKSTLDKAVSDTPWSNFSQADYTPQQWARACLIDTGEGDPDSKDRYKLPVREPSGALNRNGIHAAAGGHGVGQVQGISSEQRATAARALVRLYGQLGEDPPDSLRRMAGQGSASLDFDMFTDAMRKVLELPVIARKAAVDALVVAYQPDSIADEAAGPADEPDPTADAAATTPPGPAGTAQPTSEVGSASDYALSLLTRPSGPPDGAPGDEPQTALVDPLAALEMRRENQERDRLEAEVRAALGGAP